jgi:hypothetical protein
MTRHSDKKRAVTPEAKRPLPSRQRSSLHPMRPKLSPRLFYFTGDVTLGRASELLTP